MCCSIGARNTSHAVKTLLERHLSLEDLAFYCRSQLVRVSSTYSYVDALRRTQYRTPVGPLENAVLCCELFTKLYHSNDRAVLLRVCIDMGMLLHSNGHFLISTVADRLSMFAICGRLPWKAPTDAKDPTLLDSWLTDGGKVVSPTHRPHFSPQKHFFLNVSGTHFC
jgi:hypothetical protein